jgi:hypothetical protein
LGRCFISASTLKLLVKAVCQRIVFQKLTRIGGHQVTDSIVVFLYLSFLALVIGIIWILVKYYISSLSRIDDELQGVTVMQKELTQQLCKIISTLEEVDKTEITKADLENSSRVTHNYLEKVLWQIRFDEDKYAESTATTGNGTVVSANAKVNNTNNQRENDKEAMADTKSMKAIMKNEDDDDYSIILKYMSRTGKDGTNALHILDDVRDSRVR